MKKLLKLIIILFLTNLCLGADSITQYNITWTFDRNITSDGAGNTYQYGTFITGDYWIVGDPDVNIVSIEPNSQEYADYTTYCRAGGSPHVSDRTMNGSEINPSPVPSPLYQGLDSELGRWHNTSCYGYTHGAYSAALNVALDVDAANHLVLDPNTSLISTKSILTGGYPQLSDAAILTILPTAPDANSFRPPYVGDDKTINFNLSDVNYATLSTLSAAGSRPSLSTVTSSVSRPWIDWWPCESGESRYTHPSNNMPEYGDPISTTIGTAALMANSNFSNAEKQALVVGLCQIGIDNYAIIKTGNGRRAWVSSGGQASARKFPILFAGVVLGDADMQAIGTYSGDYLEDNAYFGNEPPNVYGWVKNISDYEFFGEDTQTFYVEETSTGVYNYGLPTDVGYTDSNVGMPEWGQAHTHYPENDQTTWTGASNRAGYRYISQTWSGWVLAVHIMDANTNMKTLWNHDALFDYMDRWWSIETDGREGNAWQKAMWLQYRGDYPPVWSEATPTPSPTPSPSPTPTPTPRASSITQYGITWTFDANYHYGTFCQGDYWVLGDPNVVISSISPSPTGGLNGFEVNPTVQAYQPYDNRQPHGDPNYYNAALQPSLPVTVEPNSSVVSTISNGSSDCVGSPTYNGWLLYKNGHDGSAHCSSSVVNTMAVLTVVNAAPPNDGNTVFRPPYIAPNTSFYATNDLQTDLIDLGLTSVAGEPNLTETARWFQRPWLDHMINGIGNREFHPTQNMYDYGAGIALDTGSGALRLLMDDSLAEKTDLLYNYVQLGIDLYHIFEEGQYWQAEGGHGQGRKLPIIFAGALLDNSNMLAVDSCSTTYEGFQEDCQTFYDDANDLGISGFPRWGNRHCINGDIDETDTYRIGETGDPWCATALVIRLMGLEEEWGDQEYLDYVDRYIVEEGGVSGTWSSSWAGTMWDTYRDSVNLCTNSVRDRCGGSNGDGRGCNEDTPLFYGETATDVGGSCGEAPILGNPSDSGLTGDGLTGGGLTGPAWPFEEHGDLTR